MSLFDAEIITFLAERRGLMVRQLLWIGRRLRSTGAQSFVGFWTGDDHADFSIDGEVRSYFGAGALIPRQSLRFTAGLQVQTADFNLHPAAPEVRDTLLAYHLDRQPLEFHLAVFDPETEALVHAPQRVWRGTIETPTMARPAKGEGVEPAVISAVSGAQRLTRGLPEMRTHEAQLRRAAAMGQPTDNFRKYATVAGAVERTFGRGT